MIRVYAEIFCWKNVSSFCIAKATHIFSAKNIRILCIESARTVNERTFNELVKLTMLWTTGPRLLKVANKLNNFEIRLLMFSCVQRNLILKTILIMITGRSFTDKLSTECFVHISIQLFTYDNIVLLIYESIKGLHSETALSLFGTAKKSD